MAVSGISSGVPQENSGKIMGRLLEKYIPNCEMLRILGFRAPGKANLPGTLGRHCLDLVPTFPYVFFLLEIDSSSLLEFFSDNSLLEFFADNRKGGFAKRKGVSGFLERSQTATRIKVLVGRCGYESGGRKIGRGPAK